MEPTLLETPPQISRAYFLKRLDELSQMERDMRPDVSKVLDGFAPHVPPTLLGEFLDKVEDLTARQGTLAQSELLDVLVRGSDVCLWGAVLTFQSRQALETIAEEILVRQEYRFRSHQKAPLVIDAGANIGLATYYAIRMNNAGRVICFEPNPETFALLNANVERNRWDKVELHNVAVSGEDGEASLSVFKDAPLAASLDPRNNDGVSSQIVVPTMDLRPFLNQPVGLLKIDIEGAEADVLEACIDDLGQVENIFVEVHPVQGQLPDLLVRVLRVLEAAKFMVHVARSPWSEKTHHIRPMMNVHRTYSLSVYGTRITP